jgi:hypothetical protein
MLRKLGCIHIQAFRMICIATSITASICLIFYLRKAASAFYTTNMRLSKGEMQRKYYLYIYILFISNTKGLLSHYPVPLTLVFFQNHEDPPIHTVQPP